MQNLSAEQVRVLLDRGNQPRPIVLDVREKWEYENKHIPDSLHIPMGELSHRLDMIESERQVIVVCEHGVRSYQVAIYLEHIGWKDVINLKGGISSW